MPQPPEQPVTIRSSGGQLPPEELAATLGHLFGFHIEEDDLGSQDNFISRVLAVGVKRRTEILLSIFANCEWEGDCLIWQGSTSGKGRGGGYGRCSFEGITSAVHRVVYAAVYGPIPGKKQVDHECNRRLCCNPFHLKHTTHKRNQKLRDKRRSKLKQ